MSDTGLCKYGVDGSITYYDYEKKISEKYVCSYVALPNNNHCMFHDEEYWQTDAGEVMKSFWDWLVQEIHGSKPVLCIGFNLPEIIDFQNAPVSPQFDKDVYFSASNFIKNANFSGADFTKKADFSGASFKDEVNFSGASFKDEVNFSGADFDGEVNFSGADFSKNAWFSGATFNESKIARFSDAIFDGEVNFLDAKFKGEVNFSGADFSKNAFFSKLIFEKTVDFSNAVFRKDSVPVFNGATFKGDVNFSAVNFLNNAFFQGAIFEKTVDFTNASLTKGSAAIFSGAKFKDKAKFLVTFYETLFDKAVFEKKVDFTNAYLWSKTYFNDADFYDAQFSNTSFKDETYFLGAKFHKEADFSGADFDGKTSFRDAEFLDKAIANFSNANFVAEVFFSNASFNNLANFSGAVFNKEANFSKVVFEGNLDFSSANFNENAVANFSFAKFQEADFSVSRFQEVRFISSSFNKKVLFRGTGFQKAIFNNSKFQCPVNFSGVMLDEGYFYSTVFNDKVDFNQAMLGKVSFSETQFKDDASFNFVIFEDEEKVLFGIENLTKVSFVNTDITRVRFGGKVRWGEHDEFELSDERNLKQRFKNNSLTIGNKEILRLGTIITVYRNLRENYEYSLRFEEADKFFRKEMDLKRLYRETISRDNRITIKKNNWFSRNLSMTGLYYRISDYGLSYKRPASIAALFIFVDILISFFTNPKYHPFTSSGLSNLGNATQTSLSHIFQIKDQTLSEYFTGVLTISVLGVLAVAAFKRTFEKKFRKG
jgi:uncharacterized protein YjbI with pentapeptide repeats